MRICLFEDRRAANLTPLTLTRPTFELLCGLDSLRVKQERFFQPDVVGFLVRTPLSEQLRQTEPNAPINDPLWLRTGTTTLVNGRWLPPAEPSTTNDHRPMIALCQGEIAFAQLPAALLSGLTVDTLDDCLSEWQDTLPRETVGGTMIRYTWDLLDCNGEQIVADFSLLDRELRGLYPVQAHIVGRIDGLSLDASAHVDPCVVFDTTKGPIVIAADARIEAFSHLQGPCFIGVGTRILGAKIRSGTSIGPNCRIGGDVSASIVFANCTIGNDVVLGQSLLGEGVNLAAGTRTAIHRLDHGRIRITMNGVKFDTLRTTLGSILGDHVTTGPGVLLNCGSVVGPNAMLLPTGQLLPNMVPANTTVGPDGMFPHEQESVSTSRPGVA